MTLSEELQWRGFINQTTLKDLKQLDTHKFTFYWGVDPSADSMTVGNLAAAMMVRHFIDHGHKAILLVGGATGMIGDPDGKAEERDLKSLAQVAKNKRGIAVQYKQVFAGEHFTIVDNYDWFKTMNYLAFLREVGKHMSMTQMLDREFVQSRIGKGGKGISYAEFSYSLIQGYDFLHLFRKHGATLQLSGADQWGNSIAGVELIRKLEGAEAHVYTCPLVINKATGVKFGKTEGGAVWLDPKKTSVFDFYQFWLNVDDQGVGDYMKIYTLLSRDEVKKVMVEFEKNPAGRLAQKTLAYEVTKLVHGEKQAETVKLDTERLFSKHVTIMPDPIHIKFKLPEVTAIATVKVNPGKHNVVDLLVKAGLADSNSAARRLLQQGGVKLNQQKVEHETITVKSGDLLQAGKRRFVKIG